MPYPNQQIPAYEPQTPHQPAYLQGHIFPHTPQYTPQPYQRDASASHSMVQYPRPGLALATQPEIPPQIKPYMIPPEYQPYFASQNPSAYYLLALVPIYHNAGQSPPFMPQNTHYSNQQVFDRAYVQMQPLTPTPPHHGYSTFSALNGSGSSLITPPSFNGPTPSSNMTVSPTVCHLSNVQGYHHQLDSTQQLVRPPVFTAPQTAPGPSLLSQSLSDSSASLDVEIEEEVEALVESLNPAKEDVASTDIGEYLDLTETSSQWSFKPDHSSRGNNKGLQVDDAKNTMCTSELSNWEMGESAYVPYLRSHARRICDDAPQAQVEHTKVVTNASADTADTVARNTLQADTGNVGESGASVNRNKTSPPSTQYHLLEPNKKRARDTLVFADKLCFMLTNPTIAEHIYWNTKGTVVVIPNEDAFAEIVCPLYFDHQSFGSFVRQCCTYGVHRVHRGTQDIDGVDVRCHELTHPLLKRDDAILWERVADLQLRAGVKANEGVAGDVRISGVVNKPAISSAGRSGTKKGKANKKTLGRKKGKKRTKRQ